MSSKEVAAQGGSNNSLSVTKSFKSSLMKNGTGLENITSDDLLIPRLTILQGLSPQVTKGDPLFDPNAKNGDIYDVGMQEVFGDEVHFLPVHFVKEWLEWAPRSSGKGLINIHQTSEILDKCERDERNRPITPEGNLISETYQFFGLNLTCGGRRSFLPMSSTQIKKAKRLVTLASSEVLTDEEDGSEFTPPIFYRTYKLSTVPEKNNDGSWTGWKVERDVSIDQLPDFEKIMNIVDSFRESIIKGEVKGDIQSMADEAASATSNDGAM